MRSLIALCSSLGLAACLTQPAHAQVLEYGSQEDLRDVQYLFIDTGTEVSVREDIIDKLRKQLPNLKIASIIEEADAAIIFASSRQTVQFGTWMQGTGQGQATCFGGGGMVSCSSQSSASGYAVPMQATVRYGRGFVVVPGTQAGAIRLVMEHSLESRMLEKSPWSKFADRFIKAYRRANPTPVVERPPRRYSPPSTPSAAPSLSRVSAEPGSVTFKGSYTATIAPGSQFEGALQLGGTPEMLSGQLATSTGRIAAVTGRMLPDGRSMDLHFSFTDACGGAARATAMIVGTTLSGSYEAQDCNGQYQGALLLTKQP